MLGTKLYWNPFFFTGHQNVKKLNGRAARTAYGLTFLPYCKITVSFFLFSVKMQSKQDESCTNRLQFVKKKHKLTPYKTKNGEPNYVVHKFFFNFLQELPLQKLGDRHPNSKNLGTDIQILQSWLVGWCMYCVTFRLHDIKKLQCPLNTHFLNTFYCVKIDSKISSVLKLPEKMYYSLFQEYVCC